MLAFDNGLEEFTPIESHRNAPTPSRHHVFVVVEGRRNTQQSVHYSKKCKEGDRGGCLSTLSAPAKTASFWVPFMRKALQGIVYHKAVDVQCEKTTSKVLATQRGAKKVPKIVGCRCERHGTTVVGSG